MHSHFAQTILTKGMQSNTCSGSVSILTNGYLDEQLLRILRRRGGGQQGEDFTLLVNLRGRKEFVFDLILKLEGTKIAELAEELVLMGRKGFPFESTYEVRATLATELMEKYDITGITVFQLQEALGLVGTKELQSLAHLEVEGQKAFDFHLNKNIKGKKITDVVFASDLTGTKETQNDTKIQIKGKRDITNILIVLDILGGKNERTDK